MLDRELPLRSSVKVWTSGIQVRNNLNSAWTPAHAADRGKALDWNQLGSDTGRCTFTEEAAIDADWRLHAATCSHASSHAVLTFCRVRFRRSQTRHESCRLLGCEDALPTPAEKTASVLVIITALDAAGQYHDYRMSTL
jgi:hypothetical protein